ncbi:MAG: glycosyltransferase [Gammaproteobacteria bacterium]|nr:glycosyltransferase [Gammaproteobacteria bacterium]
MSKKSAHSAPFQLVFTVAIKDELPELWLKSQAVAVCHMRALRAGILSKIGRDQPPGVLFVITGVGEQAARDAATWIVANINPLYVVNVGSAAGIGADSRLGQWITPHAVYDEAGRSVAVDSRLPFPWPPSIARCIGGHLLSVRAPQLGQYPDAWRAHQYLDMEAFAQAEVFASAGVAFHLFKMISDDSGREAAQQFGRMLYIMRQQLEQVLIFLTPAERATAPISVIIPVHNRAATIERCIASVLEQSLPPQEIIVVDDGSDDDTVARIRSFGTPVQLIRSERNHGVSHARNRGIAQACGDWLAFLDSDDTWQPDKLANQWHFLCRYPFYEIIQSEEIWVRDGVRVNAPKRNKKLQGWIWQALLAMCLVSPSSVMIRRHLFEQYGLFDEQLPACEDYDLWIRIARHKVVGLESSLSLIKYGGHDDQLSQRYEAMDRFRVQALMKAIDTEPESDYRTALTAAAREKLTILFNGARKRGNEQGKAEYAALLQHVDSTGDERG